MIEFQNVSRQFGSWKAVDDVSLTVEAGELLVLIGPSGSGKSTLLRMINRLIDPTGGRILFGGDDVTTLKPESLRRRIGYAIQSVGLFPHWTVERNIATVPKLLGWSREKINARVDELLGLLNLDAARYRSAYPHQLSGGQAQRVGVARALAANPDVLLMDEPFGALDPITRASLQTETARICHELGKTIVFVTHDMDEALKLGSRIAVLDQGKLVRLASPHDILSAPKQPLIFDLLGGEGLGLRRLSFESVRSLARPSELADAPFIAADASLADALNLILANGVDRLGVRDTDGTSIGSVHLSDFPRSLQPEPVA